MGQRIQAPVNIFENPSELLRLSAAQSALFPIRPIMTMARGIMLMTIIMLINKAFLFISGSPFIKFMLGYYHIEITMSTLFYIFYKFF